MNRKLFINALLSSIPSNYTSIVIAEDIATLPTTDRQQQTVILADSLKNDYDSILESASLVSGHFDICVSLIDNYELDLKVVHKHQSWLLHRSNALIATLIRDTCWIRPKMSFEEVNRKLSKFMEVDFSIFDYLIILENYYVENKKCDVVQIIGKH